MNRQELFELHAKLAAEALNIMRAKNADYAGKGDDTPFANFERSEVLGIPRELGLLVRVMDKICRIKSFIENGALAVKSEPVDDAILDIINYMVLLQGMIVENRRATKTEDTRELEPQDILKHLPAFPVPDHGEGNTYEMATCPQCGYFGWGLHYCPGRKSGDALCPIKSTP